MSNTNKIVNDIPDDWKFLKNKYIFEKRKEKVNENYRNFQLLSLTTKGVRKKDIETTGGKLPESFNTYQRVYKKDLILCLFDLDVSAVFSGLSNFDGMITSAYDVFKVKKGFNEEFLKYLFDLYKYDRYYIQYSKSLRKTINTENFLSIATLVPPFQTQQKIANLLAKKISRIDKIIEETNTSIEELKKYKQSLITEVVTKGLNKNVEMKDSGIEWIGEIPKDWSIVKINKVAKIKNGKEVSTETGVIPVYGSGGIFKYTDDFLYEGESVLFGRKGTIGKPIYTNSKIWTVDTMFYTEIKNTIIAKLFYYFLTAFPWSIYETKTALPSIVGGEIEQSKILLPNKKTQQEIVNYLDEKTEAIDNIVESKYILIREYESYKKSLIYEYVTGKKEVGEEVE